MNPLVSSAFLPVAQREVWTRLGDRFSGKNAEFDSGDFMSLAGVAALAMAFVWLLKKLQEWQQGRRKSNEPRHLFADLCSAHQLRWSERRALRKLVAEADLQMNALAFVYPDLFQDEQLIAACGAKPAVIEKIRTKLFAGLDQTAPSDAADTTAEDRAPDVPPTPVVAVPTPVASPSHTTV